MQAIYQANRARVPSSIDLWTLNDGMTANDDVGPGGGAETGYKLAEANGSGEFYAEWQFTTPQTQLYPQSGDFVVSFFAKADERDWVWVDVGNGAVNRYCYFDLANGAVGTRYSPDDELVATIEAVGGGWYRCTVYGRSQPYTTNVSPPFYSDAAGVSIGPANADDAFGYVGTAGSGVLVAGVSFDAAGLEAY